MGISLLGWIRHQSSAGSRAETRAIKRHQSLVSQSFLGRKLVTVMHRCLLCPPCKLAHWAVEGLYSTYSLC